MMLFLYLNTSLRGQGIRCCQSTNKSLFDSSHTSTAMKHSEAAVLTVADLADLFTEDTEPLEWISALGSSLGTYQVKQTGEKGSSRFTQRWQILHIPLFLYKHPDVMKRISKNYFKKSLMDDDYKFLTCWILTQFRADAFASLVIVVSYWSNLFSCVCLSHLVRCVHLCATSLHLQMDWTTLRHSHNIQEIKVCEWRVVRLLLPDFFVPSFYCVVKKMKQEERHWFVLTSDINSLLLFYNWSERLSRDFFGRAIDLKLFHCWNKATQFGLTMAPILFARQKEAQCADCWKLIL